MAGQRLGDRVVSFAENTSKSATSEADIHAVVTAVAAMADVPATPRADDAPRPAFWQGCTPCCHVRVEATPVEVFALADAAKTTFLPDALAAFRARVVRADERTRGLSERAHSATGVACPMLVDGACDALASRPLDCQGYESYDDAVCRRLAGRYDFFLVPVNKGRSRRHDEARKGLQAASRRLGRQADLLELTGALRIALQGDGALDDWLAGGRPFAAVCLERSRQSAAQRAAKSP